MSVLIEAKKIEVIELRKNGLTFSEISAKLKVPKGTISRWLRGIKFEDFEQKKIIENQKDRKLRAITKSKLSNQVRKKFGEREALIDAKKILEKNYKDPIFIFVLGIYTSHGLKESNSFQFSASNIETALLIRDWLRKYFGVDPNSLKFRLFTRSNSPKSAINYWITLVGSEKKVKITNYETQNRKKMAQNNGIIQILCHKKRLEQTVSFVFRLLLDKIDKI